jgi:hypothetical protein
MGTRHRKRQQYRATDKACRNDRSRRFEPPGRPTHRRTRRTAAMTTPRDLVHEHCWHWHNCAHPVGCHTKVCDDLTAAIEARDADLRSQLEAARVLLGRCSALVCIKVSREDVRDSSTGDCGTCPPCAVRRFLAGSPGSPAEQRCTDCGGYGSAKPCRYCPRLTGSPRESAPTVDTGTPCGVCKGLGFDDGLNAMGVTVDCRACGGTGKGTP